MQLLIIALLAMLAGGGNRLNELQPILETLGGENAENILKQSEEISSMLNAVQSLAAAHPISGAGGVEKSVPARNNYVNDGGFPLAPVSRIADDRITYALSGYIATGE